MNKVYCIIGSECTIFAMQLFDLEVEAATANEAVISLIRYRGKLGAGNTGQWMEVKPIGNISKHPGNSGYNEDIDGSRRRQSRQESTGHHGTVYYDTVQVLICEEEYVETAAGKGMPATIINEIMSARSGGLPTSGTFTVGFRLEF